MLKAKLSVPDIPGADYGGILRQGVGSEYNSLAVASLEHECKERGRTVRLFLFRRYDLEDASEADAVTYNTLADETGLTPTTVTNYLASIRRDFRRILLSHLREMTATDSEYRQEARQLFGIEI